MLPENKQKIEIINNLDYRELKKYCGDIDVDIRYESENKNNVDKLDSVLLFSYANVKRFEKFIDTRLWMGRGYQFLDLIYATTGTFLKLDMMELKYPSLFNAYLPLGEDGRVQIPYPMDQWVNIYGWFEYNLKYFHITKNVECAFYFGVITCLVQSGLRQRYFSEYNSIQDKDIYNEFKSKVNYDGILNKILSAKGDSLREKEYKGYTSFEREQVIDEKRYFQFIINCVALHALNYVKSNKQKLNPHLKKYENWIDDLICHLIINIDSHVVGYFSRGKLSHKLEHGLNPNFEGSYTIEDRGQARSAEYLGKDFIVHNKEVFSELEELISPIGKNYIESLFEIIFHKNNESEDYNNDDNHDYPESNRSSSSGCFIATATYESPSAKEVLILRQWRDEYLLHSYFGRIFVKIYYVISPSIAKVIKKYKILKDLSKLVLKPIINYVKK